MAFARVVLRRIRRLISVSVGVVSATAALTLIGVPRAASAGDPKELRVLLVVDRPTDPFLERVRAEIAGLGLTVVVLNRSRGREALGPLDAAAERESAVAAVRMLPTRLGVEVWIGDESSGRSLLRQAVVDESPGGPNEGLVALQTAELLRTSLLLRHSPNAQSSSGGAPSSGAAGAGGSGGPNSRGSAGAGTVAGSGPEGSGVGGGAGAGPAGLTPTTGSTGGDAAGAREAPAPKPQMGAQAAFGVLYSPQASDAALQIGLAVHRSLGPLLEIAIDLSAPVHAATLQGPEGSARVGTYWAGSTLFFRLHEPDPYLFAKAGVGMAVVNVRTEGFANIPLRGVHADALTGAAYLRAEGGIRATSWLRFGLCGLVGSTFAEVAFRFAGNDAGGWGQPFFAALIATDVRMP